MIIESATAEGIREATEAVEPPGGYQAVQLRIAEQYVEKLRPAGQGERHDDRADHRFGDTYP